MVSFPVFFDPLPPSPWNECKKESILKYDFSTEWACFSRVFSAKNFLFPLQCLGNLYM